MENKNRLNALLVPGAYLDEYIKAVTAQYRHSMTATYSTLEKAVALLEDMACGGYTPEKQQAVQHIAYVMMCYTTCTAWDCNRAKLDDAKEIGCQVKDLPLSKGLLAMMGDYGEVPPSCHVGGTTLEVAYWCVYGKRNREIINHTAELARQGCIFVGLMRSLAKPKEG